MKGQPTYMWQIYRNYKIGRDQQECKSSASMGLDRRGSRLSFKLPSPFLGPSQGYAVASHIQFISQIFQGVLSLSYLDFFLDFPKFCLLPFMVTILVPTAHASQFCLRIWLLLGMCLVEGSLSEPSQHLLHMHTEMEFSPIPHLSIHYPPLPHLPTRQSRQTDWLFTGMTRKPDHPPTRRDTETLIPFGGQ